MNKVAVLGLGAMGFRMAQKLLAARYEVAVYNRSKEPAEALASEGAFLADSPRQAAEKANLVISMVTDVEASRELWLNEESGAINGLGKASIAIESSTLTVVWVQELAQAIAHRGAEFLDAPVVGSRPQAQAGELIYLVGGAAATVAKVESVLSLLGSTLHHLGEVGAGTMMKLAVNGFFGIQVAAFGELLGTLKKFGFAEAQAVELFATLPITSIALKRIGGLMVSRAFAPNFPIRLVEKDLGYLTETAVSLEASATLAQAAQEVFAHAKQAGFSEDDIAGTYQLFV